MGKFHSTAKSSTFKMPSLITKEYGIVVGSHKSLGQQKQNQINILTSSLESLLLFLILNHCSLAFHYKWSACDKTDLIQEDLYHSKYVAL